MPHAYTRARPGERKQDAAQPHRQAPGRSPTSHPKTVWIIGSLPQLASLTVCPGAGVRRQGLVLTADGRQAHEARP